MANQKPLQISHGLTARGDGIGHGEYCEDGFVSCDVNPQGRCRFGEQNMIFVASHKVQYIRRVSDPMCIQGYYGTNGARTARQISSGIQHA